MAKSQWLLLLFTEILSAISVIVLIISFSTDYWIVAEARYDNLTNTVGTSQINYGLFDGKLTRIIIGTPRRFDLTIVCKYEANKCYYSCQRTSTERQQELEALLKGETYKDCPLSSHQPKISALYEQVNEFQATRLSLEEEFLSNGLWLATVIFLAISCVFALISGFFSMLNIFCKPFLMLTSAFGLYIWNGISAILCFLTLIFWMSLHLIFIRKNIAITDTLNTTTRYSSDGLASLGFSFWILLISIFCHIGNMALVYYRSYRLQHQPKPSVIAIKKNQSAHQPDFY